MIELTDLLQVLPNKTPPPLRPGAHRALSQPAPYAGFIAPPLRSSDPHASKFAKPIVLISAPGAVGKSTLANFVAAGRATALWDLSQLVLGDNTFLGTLASAFGAGQLSTLLAGVSSGETLFVFDAFDEGELLSGWDRVESFVREFWSYLEGASSVSAVLLARTETASLLDVLLRDLGGRTPRHTLVEIEFFDEASSKRFIERQLTEVHTQEQHAKHPEPFRRALDTLFSVIARVLAGETNDPWSSHVCRSFLGYAPVLQALAAYLAQFKNYQDILTVLNGAGFGETQSEILPSLMRDLLKREQDKFITAVRSRPRPVGTPEPEWGELYSERDQLQRVFAYVIEDNDASRPPTSLSPWMADVCTEALQSFVPNHPFLRGRGFAGPAFQDYVYASLLAEPSIAPLVETWLEQNLYVPTPLFAPFYSLAAHGSGAGTHAGLLYESAAAQFGLDCTSLTALVNPEEESAIHVLAVVPEGEFGNDDAFRINLRVDDSTPLIFRHRLRSAVLNVRGAVLLSARNQLDLSDVEIEATRVEFRSPVLSIRGLSNRNNVLIQATEAPRSLAQLRIEVRNPAVLRVNWPGAATYPWAPYADPTVFIEARDSGGAFAALQRILRWFRKDRRESLARYRELIDNVVVGHSDIRRSMLKFLLRKGILRADGKFYVLDAASAVQLGLNWSSLRSDSPAVPLSPLLDEFLADVSDGGQRAMRDSTLPLGLDKT